MSDARPQPPRFQFSLRKALLWMVVWALYLGLTTWFVKPLDIDRIIVAGIGTVYFGCTLAIRVLAGGGRGCIIATLGTGMLLAVLSGVAYFVLPVSGSIIEFVLIVTLYFLAGAMLGFLLFAPVHGVVTAIDWIDNKMESKRQPPDLDTPFSP